MIYYLIMDINNTNERMNISYEKLKEKYVDDLEREHDLLPIKISKFCGYTFLTYFHKKSTINDIYKYIDLFFVNTSNSNNLYLKQNNKYKLITRSNNMLLYDFIKINKLKPVYKLPTRIVYEIWFNDSCNKNNIDIIHHHCIEKN